MAKVDEVIKDLNKNLQIKNIIKLEIMTNDQVSLVGYITIPFYKSKDIYLNQLNMSDPRLLYTEVTLNKYKVNDPVFIKQELKRSTGWYCCIDSCYCSYWWRLCKVW